MLQRGTLPDTEAAVPGPKTGNPARIEPYDENPRCRGCCADPRRPTSPEHAAFHVWRRLGSWSAGGRLDQAVSSRG
jgi:hypothetical protein